MGAMAVIGEFPAQMASNAENVSIWWRHHEYLGSAVQELIEYRTLHYRFDSLAAGIYDNKSVENVILKCNFATNITFIFSE